MILRAILMLPILAGREEVGARAETLRELARAEAPPAVAAPTPAGAANAEASPEGPKVAPPRNPDPDAHLKSEPATPANTYPLKTLVGASGECLRLIMEGEVAAEPLHRRGRLQLRG
jgi:hypothetical protein